MAYTGQKRDRARTSNPAPKCEGCGGTEFIGAGSRLDKQGKWHMIQCTTCGHKQKDKLIKPFKKKDIEKTCKISGLALATRTYEPDN